MSNNDQNKKNKTNLDDALAIKRLMLKYNINGDILKEMIIKNSGALSEGMIRDVCVSNDVETHNKMMNEIDSAYVEVFEKISESRALKSKDNMGKITIGNIRAKKDSANPVMLVTSIKAVSSFFACELSGKIKVEDLQELRSETDMTNFSSSAMFFFKNMIVD